MANILIKEDNFNFEINSKVKSVTIFSNRAEVTRFKKINIKKGIQNISFFNLGINIDSNTIRAKISNSNIKIVSNYLESNNLYFYREKENQKFFEELISEIKNYIKLEDDQFGYSIENSLIYDLREYIQLSLNDLILDSDNSLTKLKEALIFLEEKINENSNSIINIKNSIKDLMEKITNYKFRINQIRNMDKKVQNNIIVTIDSKEETEVELEISYILTGVNWRSVYDASLDTKRNKITFSYYGEVIQSTGENWENCTFILSTAIVDTDIEIPKIYPVTLSGYSQKRDKTIKVQNEVYKESFEEGDGFSEEKEESAGEDEPLEAELDIDMRVKSEKKGVSHSFVIEKLSTIISDGKYHKLSIVNTEFDTELFYESVPELMEYFYLKANIKNILEIPFLPGSVMIYRNGSYMGRSNLKYIAPQETFPLSFGIDDDLRIKRIVYYNRYIEPNNIFSKKQREFKYIYVLNNFKKEETQVKIKESIHRSEIKEISVEIKEDTTPDYKINEESIVSYDIKLKPDSYKSQEIVFHYIISSSKSFPLENI